MDNFFAMCIPIWRPVAECAHYQVSTTGVLVSYKRTKPKNITPIVDKGYHRVNIQLGKKGHFVCKRMHRLVAETFIDNPESLPEVNHKNGKKWDNRIENLEWSSHKGNMEHAGEYGLLTYGTDSKSSKLTVDQVRRIREEAQKPKRSLRSISRDFGVSYPTVRSIVKGLKWKKFYEEEAS